jgi:hypothetical protein
MAWDFANDGIYGVGVAGQTGAGLRGLLQAKLIGPEMITGGTLGIEASILTLIVTLLVSMLLLWMAHRKGQFVSRKKHVPAIA